MREIPESLRGRVFGRSEALAAGVTSRMLEGGRFTRVHQGVWRLASHEMRPTDWVDAARLALPSAAHLTGVTRLQQLGLDHGPTRPVRFVVEGDLHRAVPGIFLHRTSRLPPLDDVGVTVSAAFVSYCSLARLIDAIKVGDWLLHRGHTTTSDLLTLVADAPWRAGAAETVLVCGHLDGRSRSLPESEVRSVLGFAGLPPPESNTRLPLPADVRPVLGDLYYRQWRTVVEYEGEHHQTSRHQYVTDLQRYAAIRAGDLDYVQVTTESLRRPRRVVAEVHRALCRHGYDGPPPELGPHWYSLFRRVAGLVPRRAFGGEQATVLRAG